MKIKIEKMDLEQLIAAVGISLLEYYDNNGKDEIPYGELYHYPIKKFWEMIEEEYEQEIFYEN